MIDHEAERAIWAAAYAQKFSADVRDMTRQGLRHPDRKRREEIAGDAAAMADWAVQAFRDADMRAPHADNITDGAAGANPVPGVVEDRGQSENPVPTLGVNPGPSTSQDGAAGANPADGGDGVFPTPPDFTPGSEPGPSTSQSARSILIGLVRSAEEGLECPECEATDEHDPACPVLEWRAALEEPSTSHDETVMQELQRLGQESATSQPMTADEADGADGGLCTHGLGAALCHEPGCFGPSTSQPMTADEAIEWALTWWEENPHGWPSLCADAWAERKAGV